ncbi:MAG: hypothetical protein ABSD58_11885 [Verrucomicrobiia bacterium]
MNAVVNTIDYAGPFVELIIAFFGFRNLRDEPGADRKTRRERCIIVLALVAASLWLVDTKLNHRLSVLQQAEINAQIQPRNITETQARDFIYQTQHVTKIPVVIYESPYGEDTDNFTIQFVAMLRNAGFPPAEGASKTGVRRDVTIHVVKPIGLKYTPPWVEVLSYSTTNIFWSVLHYEHGPNGIERPVVTSSDTGEVYQAILVSLRNAKIPTNWEPLLTDASPGQWEIFIPPRSY